MDGWTDGRMDGWMDGRMDVRMHGCMDVWMYVWIYGCMGGWMDGWMDAHMHECMNAMYVINTMRYILIYAIRISNSYSSDLMEYPGVICILQYWDLMGGVMRYLMGIS